MRFSFEFNLCASFQIGIYQLTVINLNHALMTLMFDPACGLANELNVWFCFVAVIERLALSLHTQLEMAEFKN